MTLTGNKLLSAAIVLAASQMVNAEDITAPELVSFEAGTPAKAAEVNSNFEGLKAYGEGLQGLVEDQETQLSDLTTKSEEQTQIIETLTEAVTSIGSFINTAFVDHETRLLSVESQAETLATDIDENATSIDTLTDSDSNQDALISAQADLIDALEARIEELEASSGEDSFDIAVYGDGDLIGYTNKINLMTNYSPYIPLKTSYGMVAIDHGSADDAFKLRAFDPIRNEKAGENSYSIYYSNSSCTTYVYARGSGDGNPILLTKVANTIDEDILFVTNDDLFHAAAGTVFDTNATTIYQMNEGVCTQYESFTSGVTIPVEKLNDLKIHYSTLVVDGYVTN